MLAIWISREQEALYTVVVGVTVIIVVIIIVVPVVAFAAILRDTGLAERDQGWCLLPVADTIHLGAVTVVHVVAFVRNSYHRTADIPAAIGYIVVVQLGAHGDIAHEHEAGESE